MEEEKKKESGWPIEDDELDNVSGGMRAAVAATPCPKCKTQGRDTGSGNEYKCPNCGCRWDSLTGEILN